MNLSEAVTWGHSMHEYRLMFALSVPGFSLVLNASSEAGENGPEAPPFRTGDGQAGERDDLVYPSYVCVGFHPHG
jgi:hypothetical protein